VAARGEAPLAGPRRALQPGHARRTDRRRRRERSEPAHARDPRRHRAGRVRRLRLEGALALGPGRLLISARWFR
jgi:hypothetical protein